MSLNIFAFSSLVLMVTSGIVIFLTYFYGKGKQRFLNRLWILFNASVFIWGFGGFFMALATNQINAAFWCRIGLYGVIFTSVFFFHVALILSNIEQNKIYLYIIYLQGFLTSLANSFHLLTSNMQYIFNSFYYPVSRDLTYPFVYSTWILIVLCGEYLLLKTYLNSHGIKRMQIIYFFIGTVIGFFGGCINFLPVFNVKIYPYSNFLIAVYCVIATYAILRYRFMDIKIAVTRAGIFILVYALVLGIPFWIGYRYKLWAHSTWVMLVLATLGPFIYNRLRHQAESRLLAEERRARQLLIQASEGMMRIRSIKRLVSLMVHVTCKTLKLESAAVFLLDEGMDSYKLEAVRLKSKYRYVEAMTKDNALIQKLSTLEEPLVHEEVKTHAKDKPGNSNHEIESQMAALSAAVIIPASSRGQLLGFLVLGEKKSKRMYSPEDLSVLWVLSNQAALAIENAQFHKKAQEQLLKEDREMTARFIGHGASHQFGNVLNRIIQRSSGREMDIDEMDLNATSNEELKKLLLELKVDFKAITTAGMQGKEIVSGILSMGAGSPVDFKQEDLKTIIQRSIQTIKLKQSKTHIQQMDLPPEIVAQIPDNLPKIWCNSLQIEQVLDNMLDNGLEAIEEKENMIKFGELKSEGVFRGRVIIKAGIAEDRIHLEILDNGIGIKDENLKNMFTPFFTTKATERLSRKGHGIGMHMVKEIMKAHQGKIYVAHSEYSAGTTFIIELPLKITENKKP